jgi:hypothetical protein
MHAQQNDDDARRIEVKNTSEIDDYMTNAFKAGLGPVALILNVLSILVRMRQASAERTIPA